MFEKKPLHGSFFGGCYPLIFFCAWLTRSSPFELKFVLSTIIFKYILLKWNNSIYLKKRRVQKYIRITWQYLERKVGRMRKCLLSGRNSKQVSILSLKKEDGMEKQLSVPKVGQPPLIPFRVILFRNFSQ